MSITNETYKAMTPQKTKLIISVSPREITESLSRELIKAQPNGISIIFDPSFEEKIPLVSQFVRNIRKNTSHPLAVCIDVTKQTRATIDKSEKPRELAYGEEVLLCKSEHRLANGIKIKADHWGELFKLDSRVFLGYRSIILVVKEVSQECVTAQVSQGGTLYPETPVYVPATRKATSLGDLSALNPGYLQDIEIDYLILPGLTRKKEIDHIEKQFAKLSIKRPWLISKIETEESYKNLDNILEVSHGIIISRRDLALSVNPATVPMMSKEILYKCNENHKLSFLEGELLSFAKLASTPTRSEVSDLANAIIDGVDSVIVPESSTSRSKDEIKADRNKALSLYQRVIHDLEKNDSVALNWQKKEISVNTEMDIVAYYALETAKRTNARAIVCITKAGNTALRLASFQGPIPIIATTFTAETLNKLALIRGVQGILLKSSPNLDQILPLINSTLKKDTGLTVNDHYVLVSLTISSVGHDASNLFTVQKIT